MATVGHLAVTISKIQLDVHSLDISVEPPKQTFLGVRHALLTTLMGLRMPQQARPKHSEVLDARNLKRIDNRNLQRQTCLLSELLAKNKRKNNNNNFKEKKYGEFGHRSQIL